MTAPQQQQQQQTPAFAWESSTLEDAYARFYRPRPRVVEMPKPTLVPSPAAAPPELVVIDTARQLSPSQLNTFVGDCQIKWLYRNVLKLPDPKDAGRALGSAVHDALAQNFRQKIETKQDLEVVAVREILLDKLADELDEAQLTDEDKTEDLQELGEGLVSLYMEQAAPSIQPAGVELHVEGAIGGVHVTGYVDLLTAEGEIIDIKTANKKPAGLRADHRRQLATYAVLTPNASGRTRLDTMTKTKTMALHQQTLDVQPVDRKEIERLYPLAQEAMRSGLYFPNRSSLLCSRKYCSFWRRCVDEFGGEVL